MKNIIREIALKFASLGFPSIVVLEKILSIFILRREFKEIFTSRHYSSRKEMWVAEIKTFLENDSMTYIEFGVWEGDSIIHIANELPNPQNRFFGFDSFEGLPDTWDTMSESFDSGHFSTNGITPEINDNRVRFIKGWFQNSGEPFLESVELGESRLVVHYDADLYSSTLYTLMQIDRLKVKYLAIFDELPDQEVRAVYNYMQATGAKVKFIARTGPTYNYPWQVTAIIEPCKEYVV